MDTVTRVIKVVIKDLEREKEPSIKGDKNLNESRLVMKEITKKLKRDIFILYRCFYKVFNTGYYNKYS